MTALALTQSATALSPGRGAAFQATGGTAPYAYAVALGGAGGSVDAATGEYTAPGVSGVDHIVVTDAAAATATARIFVTGPLLLLADIIQKELELADGRVYLFNQKIMQPTDDGLFVALSVPMVKPFGNVRGFTGASSSASSDAYVAVAATVDIDVISKSTAALDRKEEVLFALASLYASQQQTANGFSVARLPTRFLNISGIDGAAIPYRFRLSLVMTYAFAKSKPAPYFDSFGREVYGDDGSVVDIATLISGNGPTPAPDLIDGGDAGTTLEP